MISILAYIGISIPAFWLGLMLIIVFALNLHWLPSNGMRTVGVKSVFDVAKHLILPGIVLSIGNIQYLLGIFVPIQLVS